MLRLDDAWVWDFWLADDGQQYHIFYLRASRALLDPERRHWNATIGHAVSTDLIHWRETTDALGPSPAPAFDDLTTWTGSVTRHHDGTWFMVYTGGAAAEHGLKQRIGLATSHDLYTWHKHPASPILSADPRWYEQLGDTDWPDQAWRDPWVYPDPVGDGWHMLITARAAKGPADQRGVVGHAHSVDLQNWHARPPLSAPGAGFGQLEVIQVDTVNGRPVLIFSCLHDALSQERQAARTPGGIWTTPAHSILGPFDIATATPLTDETLYSGRLVKTRTGQSALMAFRNLGPDGHYVGEITDPMPIAWSVDGRLTLAPN